MRLPILVTGADAGGSPHVRVFDAQSGQLQREFLAYSPTFSGGVRVAVGDIDHLGVPEIVTTPGPGGGPDIRVFNADTGALVHEFMAYDPGFTGGVYVAVGNISGHGDSDIITAPDAGGGPHVKVFSGASLAAGLQLPVVLQSFMAYDPNFTGGVRVAVANVAGGHASGQIAGPTGPAPIPRSYVRSELITAPGPGGGPHVKVFAAADPGRVLESFMAYDPAFRGGVYVAAGDLKGDGQAEIITGAGAGGGPHVGVFSGKDGSELQSFMAYNGDFRGGVRVAVADLGGGHMGVMTAPGSGGGPHVKVFDGANPGFVLESFMAYDPGFQGGVNVAGRGRSLGAGQGGAGQPGGSPSSGAQPLKNVNVSNQPTIDHDEISLAANPKNPLNIVVADVPILPLPGYTATFFTVDGGKTWTFVRVDGSIDGATGPNSHRSDASLQFDANGRLYLAYLVDADATSDTANSLMVVLHSTDGGRTYTNSVVVSESKTGGVFNDKELLGTGFAPGNPAQQNVYLSWTRFQGSDSVIKIAGSVDGGVTWSTPLTVNNSSDTSAHISTPRVGPNGEIYVSFMQVSNHTITLNVSPTFSGTAGSFSFGTDRQVVTIGNTVFKGPVPPQPGRGIVSIPVLAVDRSTGPNRGSLYIAYADLAVGGSSPNFDVFIVSSRDKGQTWSAPKRVNDDTGTNTQFNPWIDVDQTSGCVTLEWRDARNDPSNKKVDIFTATSPNGVAFGPNVKVSDNPSDESANDTAFDNNFLEYDGLGVFRGTAYYAWSDNSADPDMNKAIFFDTLATGCVTTRPVLPDDRFDPNETSDKATQFGVLLGTQNEPNLTINVHANGLPDYDWYRWTAGATGTFTATINIRPADGDLELHVWTINGNTLVERARSVDPGVTARTLSIPVVAGQSVFVEVKGVNFAPGLFGIGFYDMTVQLA